MVRKILGKTTAFLVLALLAALLAPGSGLALSSGALEAARAKNSSIQGPAATMVSVSPYPLSVSGCDILDVYIDVNSVTNLYALDVRLTFDPAVLEVVDFTAGSPVNLEPIVDPNLNFSASFTVRNEINNFTGTIWYAATQTFPTPAAAGSGHVARIRPARQVDGRFSL